eukprot:scaffold137700_cov142-Phaeocystis_antarctica.AAC.2
MRARLVMMVNIRRVPIVGRHADHVPRCVVLGHGTGGHSRKGAQRLDAVMRVRERFCGGRSSH